LGNTRFLIKNGVSDLTLPIWGRGIANEIHEPGVPPVYRKNRRYLPFLANRSKVDQKKSYCSQQSGVCVKRHIIAILNRLCYTENIILGML
ncbi:MAG: hypothetical protein ACLT1D_14350, partial [[Clostridium] symbiosum]|uniref:hypothetical protein n=1 Tax=Clostridium symbiosum TaxID=1512 RepID=UPI001AA14C5F